MGGLQKPKGRRVKEPTQSCLNIVYMGSDRDGNTHHLHLPHTAVDLGGRRIDLRSTILAVEWGGNGMIIIM